MIKRTARVILAGSALLLVGWPTHVAAIATHPQSTLSGVSCVSASFCESVGVGPNNAGFYAPLAEVWNGKSWLPQPAPVPSGPGYISLNGVSCLSASFCEAVGSAQHAANGTSSTLAEVWNGAIWAIQPTPNVASWSQNLLYGVSCLSVSFCEAVGTGGNQTESTLAEVWDGTAWTIQPTPNPASAAYNQLNGVSCVSVGFCEAVGQAFGPGFSALAEVWDGTTWTQQTIPNPADATGYVQPQGVSCVSTGYCEAVGLYGSNGLTPTLAEVWNGTSWAVQATPNIGPMTGVSCVSAAACEAVGGNAEVWDGTSWTEQPVPFPSSLKYGSLVAVSCISAVVCEASGEGNHKSARGVPLTEGWNGTVWTPQ